VPSFQIVIPFCGRRTIEFSGHFFQVFSRFWVEHMETEKDMFFHQVFGLLLHVQPDQRTVDPTALLTVDEIVISGAGRMVY